MFNYLPNQSQSSSQSQQDFLDRLKTWNEICNAFAKVKCKMKELEDALQADDEMHMRGVLEKYTEKNKDLINQHSSWTGVRVVSVDGSVLTKDYVRYWLSWLITFLYVIDALEFAESFEAKRQLKGLLERTGYAGPGLLFL